MVIKKVRVCLGMLLYAVVVSFFAQTQASEVVDYSAYNGLLNKYVSDGALDYLRWKANDFEKFQHYISGLEKVSLLNATESQRKAFWINAYNALAIYAVLERIPGNAFLANVFSVQLIPGFFDKITYAVAGESLTLNDIETRKLREVFHDPRIHFALVCASRSCPKIQNTAFDSGGLDEALERAAEIFIQDETRNKLDRKNNMLYLSEIFKWYGTDFVNNSGSVIHYLKKYLLSLDKEYLSKNTVGIKHLFYNWLVNIKR